MDEALAEDILGEEIEEEEEEVEKEEAGLITSRKQSLRFNKDAQLERVDSSEPTSSIIRGRRGNVNSVREKEFDKGDSDVFWDKLHGKNTARRGGSKRGGDVTRRGTRRKAALEDVDRENGTDDEAPEVEADAEDPTSNGKGKERQMSQPAKDNDNDEFEVGQSELLVTQRESETKRSARKKQKLAANENEAEAKTSNVAGPSTSSLEEGEEESSKPQKKRKERIAVYRYATGGNQLGRVPWSMEETECLLTDLEVLHPQYEEALRTNVRFAVWSEILKRHGENGSLSTFLKNRNNVQLKDKARNEFERRKRAKQEVSLWYRIQVKLFY